MVVGSLLKELLSCALNSNAANFETPFMVV